MREDRNTFPMTIDLDVSEMLARLEDMQARLEGMQARADRLRDTIRIARVELDRLAAAAAARGLDPGEEGPSR